MSDSPLSVNLLIVEGTDTIQRVNAVGLHSDEAVSIPRDSVKAEEQSGYEGSGERKDGSGNTSTVRVWAHERAEQLVVRGEVAVVGVQTNVGGGGPWCVPLDGCMRL